MSNAKKFMLLPVTITDSEKLIILAEVSTALTEVEKLEAEKKRLPEAIKTLLGSIHLKNHALAAGVIEREVEIREEPNAFAATVKRFRVDTGEEVASRSMDPEEAQMQLGNSSVPAKDNVRSLAEAREKTEEQLAAGTPEEAEALRNARLADEQMERVAGLIADLTITVGDRGDGTFVAQVVDGEVPGVAQAKGLAGPIRATADEARAELVSELERLILGTEVPAPAETARAAEIDQLAADQADDDAKTKPKKGLQVPKGAKGRRTKPAKTEDVNGVDTTPPPGLDF